MLRRNAETLWILLAKHPNTHLLKLHAMKKTIQLLSVTVTMLTLCNCGTTTRVIEVTRYSPPAHTPGPGEFKVVNSYDHQRE